MCGTQCVDLTSDPHNCGKCGHDCLGGACTASTCQPVVLTSTQNHPSGIAVDSSFVYWTNRASGTAGSVAKMPINGGAVTTLATSLDAPFPIAVDASRVYWANPVNPGNVMSVPLGGGTPTTYASGRNAPSAIAVDGTNLYWAEVSGVYSVPIAGGSIFTLVGISNPQRPICPTGLAIDASNAYWSDGCLGSIVGKVPLGGGTVVSLLGGVAAGIVIDASDAYFVQVGTLYKVPLAGGAATTLATNIGGTQIIAEDATYLYTPSLVQIPKAGGTPVTLASSDPNGIAVDATAVYWTDGATSVLKVAKP
jgi:hypothetical protein